MRETGSNGGKNVLGASSDIRRVVIRAVGTLQVNVTLLVAALSTLQVNVTLLVAVVVVAIAAASGMEGLEGRGESNRHTMQRAPPTAACTYLTEQHFRLLVILIRIAF